MSQNIFNAKCLDDCATCTKEYCSDPAKEFLTCNAQAQKRIIVLENQIKEKIILNKGLAALNIGLTDQLRQIEERASRAIIEENIYNPEEAAKTFGAALDDIIELTKGGK